MRRLIQARITVVLLAATMLAGSGCHTSLRRPPAICQCVEDRWGRPRRLRRPLDVDQQSDDQPPHDETLPQQSCDARAGVVHHDGRAALVLLSRRHASAMRR